MTERARPEARRSTSLPGELGDARQARRFVRQVLTEADRLRWADDAELAVSEIVTNASLHAHSSIELTLDLRPDRLVVEVRDFNPALPTLSNHGSRATTGRGLSLVGTLALECGVQSLGREGKVVWFTIGDREALTVEEALAAWSDDSWDVEPSVDPQPPTAGHEVVLASIPPALWLSAREHHDAILRELVLYDAARGGSLREEHRVADLARGTISGALLAALGHGGYEDAHRLPSSERVPHFDTGSVPSEMDIRLPIADDVADAFAALQDVLDRAESLAAAGELFVRPALPEIVAVRDWACHEVVAQVAGVSPSPWAGVTQARFETALDERVEPAGWDDSAVRSSDRLVIAGDDANRILAVSRPLADLLGWEVDDLVGRRAITIIPPSHREAHVVGFTRHLSTGEEHLLGRPTVVPVLHADGDEIPCRLLLERAPAEGGRTVFIGWIDPVEE